MDPAKLRAMLGVSPAPGKSAAEPITLERPATHTTTDATDTVLANLDEWDLAQGDRLARKMPILPPEAWSDFHGVAYLQDPELVEVCTDEQRYKFLATMMETPEYLSLHEATSLCSTASDLAAEQFGKEFAKLQASEAKRPKERDARKEAGKQQGNALRAVGKAVASAAKEVEELNDMRNCLGMGGNGGDDKGRMDAAKVVNTFQRVRNSRQLKRICELAGMFRLMAQSKQRQKITHGYDDMVGTEMAGDVGRLLPHELAQLACPEFELEAMRRLVEKQSLCRQFKGVERIGKGPIIVCVDESGSMDGEPVCQAKAFCLGMAWIAKHQKRWCCLIGYSGGMEGTICVLKPGKWDETALLTWLEHFYGGGTTMDVPLAELPNRYWPAINPPKGKTDLIVLTDGIVRVPRQMEQDFLAWKAKEKVRCISLILGNSSGGGLQSVSDELHCIRSIDTTENGIEKCLSV